MQIIKVTADQKALIKINNTDILNSSLSEILVQITNKTFELMVQQQGISYSIDF